MMLTKTILGIALALGAALPAAADTITFNNEIADLHGTGFGNVADLLVIHAQGQEKKLGIEYGSVLWGVTGQKKGVDTYGDILGDMAKNQSSTQTAGDIAAMGINATNFEVIFNASQQGSSKGLNLNAFTLRFQNNLGGTLFDAVFTPGAPNASTIGLVDAQGTGKAGFIFHVNLTSAHAALFFADSTNRVGQFINQADGLTDTNGGQESFFIYKGDPAIVTAVPLPASLWGGLLLLGGTQIFRLRARRPQVS